MKVRRSVALSALMIAGFVIPSAARAQLAIAPFAGREFDETNDWVLFGAEAHVAVGQSGWTINPRFTYHPVSGASIVQFDGNLLYEVKPASGAVTPYAGAGLGWTHLSGDNSDSKGVANLVAGMRFHFAASGKVEPYVNSEYSFAKQFTNTYHLDVGLMFLLK